MVNSKLNIPYHITLDYIFTEKYVILNVNKLHVQHSGSVTKLRLRTHRHNPQFKKQRGIISIKYKLESYNKILTKCSNDLDLILSNFYQYFRGKN
jgi:hypothetical protein